MWGQKKCCPLLSISYLNALKSYWHPSAFLSYRSLPFLAVNFHVNLCRFAVPAEPVRREAPAAGGQDAAAAAGLAARSELVQLGREGAEIRTGEERRLTKAKPLAPAGMQQGRDRAGRASRRFTSCGGSDVLILTG